MEADLEHTSSGKASSIAAVVLSSLEIRYETMSSYALQHSIPTKTRT
jgi:hypothetical protein